MSEPDASRCPLCGQSNQCGQLLPATSAAELGTPDSESCSGSTECWCFRVTIPRPLLEQLPAEQRGKACICQACAEAATLGFDVSGDADNA